ncbi:acyl carrier protein [Pseudobacteroides cellulosolvens]|uniref:Acyl carrier protein familyprotein n=1 Tax=Pseudobacteroides cellulosolvens ATCC 35603 = DSM 2933 TaxID=398512 RepID=A0A0L6JGX1_9FIRM|nr:phosphopantetheine-binding protein [Pseudobacteroides cellulosolvens]KNY24969.1 acyl carrier protein familyprotein [Pseudobacteroides cellulosolvens ATCC 35603 = DSM 2933]
MYSDIEARVRNILKEELSQLASSEAIGPEEDISVLGITSVSYIKLLVLIEAEFGFEINNEDLSYENFNTIQKIVVYIEKRLKVA